MELIVCVVDVYVILKFLLVDNCKFEIFCIEEVLLKLSVIMLGEGVLLINREFVGVIRFISIILCIYNFCCFVYLLYFIVEWIDFLFVDFVVINLM